MFCRFRRLESNHVKFEFVRSSAVEFTEAEYLHAFPFRYPIELMFRPTESLPHRSSAILILLCMGIITLDRCNAGDLPVV